MTFVLLKIVSQILYATKNSSEVCRGLPRGAYQLQTFLFQHCAQMNYEGNWFDIFIQLTHVLNLLLKSEIG